MKITDKDQSIFENLSAMLDGELPSTESDMLLDRLLGDPELMKYWQRHQLIHDAMHEQLHEQLLVTSLQTRVSRSLQDEAVYSADRQISPDNVLPTGTNIKADPDPDPGSIKQSWFSQLMSNHLVTGTSVAASVMFATLFSVQYFQNNNETLSDLTRINQAPANQVQASIYASSVSPAVPLPAHLVSSGNPTITQYKPLADKGAVSGENSQFTWIKADPALTRQIRDYVREHETSSTIPSFNSSLTPKIRAVSYQPDQ